MLTHHKHMPQSDVTDARGADLCNLATQGCLWRRGQPITHLKSKDDTDGHDMACMNKMKSVTAIQYRMLSWHYLNPDAAVSWMLCDK